MVSLHDILINEVCHLPKNDVALCLSSGIDSQSLLFAMLDCGITPHVYSFTLEDRESRDFMEAKALAAKMCVPFTKITLPVDVETLINDCFVMAREYGAKKKTDFECLWPFLYVYTNVEEKYIVTGIPADGHFCISKKGILHYKDDVDGFRKMYFSNPNAGQRLLRQKLADKYGKVNVDPFYSPNIAEALKGMSWNELNKPQQKMPIRNSFAYFATMKVHNHTNLQLGDSGIAEHFETLLDTRLNDKGYKSVVGIYNKIIKQVNDNGTQVQLSLEFK
jgi:Asparagine synthase.